MSKSIQFGISIFDAFINEDRFKDIRNLLLNLKLQITQNFIKNLLFLQVII